MKERPIPFNAAMVCAILDGRKTQTRRIVKPQPERIPDDVWQSPEHDNGWWWSGAPKSVGCMVAAGDMHAFCPYGIRGDRLWVRETARVLTSPSMGMVCVRYEADGREAMVPWPSERLRPVTPMTCIPNGCHREAARIHLEITGVRVERLQEISEEDAKAEGVDRDPVPTHPDDQEDPREVGYPSASALAFAEATKHRRWFQSLWEQINGPGSWDANPWVWVIEFNRAEAQP